MDNNVRLGSEMTIIREGDWQVDLDHFKCSHSRNGLVIRFRRKNGAWKGQIEEITQRVYNELADVKNGHLLLYRYVCDAEAAWNRVALRENFKTQL
jgi:hypothetical protein